MGRLELVTEEWEITDSNGRVGRLEIVTREWGDLR